MEKRYWRVTGHKQCDKFFDVAIPTGCLTEAQLKELLKCLSAKAGLTYQEIVGAYVKRKTKLAHNILDVRTNGPYPEYECGIKPVFVAVVVDEEGNRIKINSPLR